MATKTKVDIVQHKKSQMCEEPEWNKCRPDNHTADQHSKSMSTEPTPKRREGKKLSSL